ncbi:FHA domain-containing protein [Gemmatimonas sp.]
MSPQLATLLALIAVGVVLIAGGAWWWVNRTPNVGADENAPLPLFGTLSAEERMRSPAVSWPAVSTSAATPPRPSAVVREFVTRTPPSSPVVPTPAVPTPLVPASSSPIPSDHPIVSDAGVPGTMVEGHALRFSIPAEGTLQFLPGRLEVGSGIDAGREIRFVRVEGPNGIEVTFGRADGEMYKHVQLRDKTVSRAHAVMRFQHAMWHLQNLSHTNPVVYNGVQMAGDAVQALTDGDRVEMGEVQFTYRSR